MITRIITITGILLLCNIISQNNVFALEKNVNDDKPKKQKKRKKSSKNISGTGTLFMFEEPKTADVDSVVLKETIIAAVADTMPQPASVATENNILTATDTSTNLITKDALEEKIAAVSKPEATVEHHSAEKGETIYSIARKYGMPVADLILYNNLSSTAINEGQKIYLKPTAASANTTTPIAEKTVAPVKATATKLPAIKLPVTRLSDDDKMASGTVLIGCYAASDEDYAKMLTGRLKEKGFSSSYFYIPDYETEGKKMYRVFAGPYPDLKAARVALTEIQKFRQKAYIFKVR